MPLTTHPHLRKSTAILLFFLCAFMAGYTANFFTLTQLNLHLISTASLLKPHRRQDLSVSTIILSIYTLNLSFIQIYWVLTLCGQNRIYHAPANRNTITFFERLTSDQLRNFQQKHSTRNIANSHGS